MNYKMKPGSKQKNTKGTFSQKDSKKIESFRKRETGHGKRVVSPNDRGKPSVGSRYSDPTYVSVEKPIRVNKRGYNI